MRKLSKRAAAYVGKLLPIYCHMSTYVVLGGGGQTFKLHSSIFKRL